MFFLDVRHLGSSGHNNIHSDHTAGKPELDSTFGPAIVSHKPSRIKADVTVDDDDTICVASIEV